MSGNVATLTLPVSGSGDVTVFAGYATSYGKVFVLPTFVLKEQIFPTNTPTIFRTKTPTTSSVVGNGGPPPGGPPVSAPFNPINPNVINSYYLALHNDSWLINTNDTSSLFNAKTEIITSSLTGYNWKITTNDIPRFKLS